MLTPQPYPLFLAEIPGSADRLPRVFRVIGWAEQDPGGSWLPVVIGEDSQAGPVSAVPPDGIYAENADAARALARERIGSSPA
jgi:hypothetical protein